MSSEVELAMSAVADGGAVNFDRERRIEESNDHHDRPNLYHANHTICK